jgi:hypothetical protein
MDEWAQYKDWIGNNHELVDSFIFRGQANHAWPLQTSFHRLPGFDLAQYLNHNLPILASRLEIIDGTYRDLSNNFEYASFLALLQHNGFPTPQLDWTYSPYIAAFFAFENAIPRFNKVKIFLFNHTQWSIDYKQEGEISQTTPHVSVIIPRAHGNRKYMIQRGIFTFTNVKDIGQHIRSHSKSGKQYLIEFEMPVSLKNKVLKELAYMGITHLSLFPTIEEACRFAREELLRNLGIIY